MFSLTTWRRFFSQFSLPSVLVLTALGVGSSAAVAQSFVSGTDRPIARLCTNQCPQNHQKIVVDSVGNAIAIWTETDSFRSKIVYSRFNAAGNAWSAPHSLQNETGTRTEIGIDANGNALAIWAVVGPDPNFETIRFSRYLASQGTWTRAANVVTQSTGMRTSNHAVSNTGEAFLATIGFGDRGASEDNGILLRYDVPTGVWTRHGFSLSSGTTAIKIAADEKGNADIAALTYDIATSNFVATAYYDGAAKQVNRLQFLDTHEGGAESFNSLGITVDAYGGAMVLWEYAFTPTDGSTPTRAIRSARRSSAARIYAPKAVPKLSNGKIVGNAALATDKEANVNAVWVQYIGSYAKIVAARYNASTGIWNTPRVIQSGNYNSRDPRLVNGANGNAYATWSQRSDAGIGSGASSTHRVLAARFAMANVTWGVPKIVQDAVRNSYQTEIGVDGFGRPVVLWPQDSTTAGVKQLRSDRLSPQ